MQNLRRVCSSFQPRFLALGRTPSRSPAELSSDGTSCTEFGVSTVKQPAATVDKSAVQVRSLHTSHVHHQQQAINTPIVQSEPWTVSTATLSAEDRLVVVSLTDGRCYKFPWVWLRDNCQCGQCFRPELQSRTVDWRTFDVKPQPRAISTDGGSVLVEWTDGHQSEFPTEWLVYRSFTPEARTRFIEEIYRTPKIPWGAAQFDKILRKFSFQDVLHNDSCLLEYLESLAVYGVATLENAPICTDQLRILSNRVAFSKRTHYGIEFEVKAKADTTNYAFQATSLQFHTDQPYYEYKPGINTLHCLMPAVASGGASRLTDCFNIANRLRETRPEVYKTLTTTLVDWSDIGFEDGAPFHSVYRSPILCEDHAGEFRRVNYNQQQRDSHFSVPLEQVEAWYEAQKEFTTELYHPDNMVSFMLKAGDILSFDNLRLVHGRADYEDEVGKERHLLAAFWDWDYVYSKIRMLKKDLV